MGGGVWCANYLVVLLLRKHRSYGEAKGRTLQKPE